MFTGCSVQWRKTEVPVDEYTLLSKAEVVVVEGEKGVYVSVKFIVWHSESLSTVCFIGVIVSILQSINPNLKVARHSSCKDWCGYLKLDSCIYHYVCFVIPYLVTYVTRLMFHCLNDEGDCTIRMFYLYWRLIVCFIRVYVNNWSLFLVYLNSTQLLMKFYCN